MRLTERRLNPWRWKLLAVAALVAAAVFSALAHWMEEKPLTVFTAQSSFSVTISQHDGKNYVSLNDVLQNTGHLETTPGKDKLTLRFNAREAEFENGEGAAKVGGNSVEFNGHAIVESDHVLVPLPSLRVLLPYLVNSSVEYHEGSRRLFLGDAGTRFALELQKGDNTRLVLSFSAPVSPQITTEPGRLRMIFKRDPIAMSSQSWQFDDALITSAGYTDSSEPELSISGTEPLLATFSDGGRTIALVPASAATTASEVTSASALTGSATTTVASTTLPAAASNPTLPHDRYLIVIDASHGGAESGAALSQKLAEKDVTLAFARSLRSKLQDRGLNILMVRDGDNTLSLDERAVLANTSQAAVYIAIHAGGLGRGVRVYTTVLASADLVNGPFVPWEKAQAGFVSGSQRLASAILTELGRNQLRVPAALLPAPVRPLNNIAGAAVAVEVAPLRDDIETLSNPNYQDTISNAVASALVAVRPKLEAGR